MNLNNQQKKIIRSVSILWIADIFVGISYGAVATGMGFDWWVPFLLALLVVAGASEFVFVGLVAGGASPLTAAFTGALVNLRHIPYGFVLQPLLGNGFKKILGIHLITDESLSFGVASKDKYINKIGYWICGIAITISWPLGTLIGALLGNSISDPNTFGLDAVFPAALLALVLPQIENRLLSLFVILGSILVLITYPIFPPGMSELFSLVSIPIVILLYKFLHVKRGNISE